MHMLLVPSYDTYFCSCPGPLQTSQQPCMLMPKYGMIVSTTVPTSWVKLWHDHNCMYLYKLTTHQWVSATEHTVLVQDWSQGSIGWTLSVLLPHLKHQLTLILRLVSLEWWGPSKSSLECGTVTTESLVHQILLDHFIQKLVLKINIIKIHMQL